ncbi:unnamed protein product [Symbiodinium sp. CCMP2592]|nr:unnamed protein product [Symbiodinium sp. CCMP2592]
MRIPFGAKVLYWAPKKQRKPERSKFSGTGIEGIFLGYHIQPGFIFKLEYVEQLSEDLDEMFPELFGPDRDKDPPPKDAKEATRKGESKSDSRAALLDDVPFSVKQKLKSSAAVAAQEPPYGYTWSGECLVKKNNKNRPNAIDHTAWKAMSKRQRATAIAEHEKKLHEENEALYREAVKADWWDGETYFDLAGREQSDFELAVAAARKGKPVRNKSEAKKEAKQSKFVGHFKLLNVGTAEQVADVFTKPFTEKNKWTHALKLIGHTTSANVAGCKPESKVEVDNKVSVAAAPDASKVVEDFAQQSFEANDYSFKTFEKLARIHTDKYNQKESYNLTFSFAGSDLLDLPEATSTIPKMAAIVVSDEFCRVNTSEADRNGVTKAMKTILQSAALNNDIISLGADHESQLLESAYSCVSTQCAAGVSLTHADATCVALRQMADLSDEGLAKLKPTARLSPKAKRAIIVVSDSSTALCKKNRRGVFVKADLDAEVNIASWTLGWAQTRYTMCWGKTLAWIVWQVEEHVKELRSNYPDHTIDVICWWCGNEISGQWGCIPTRLGPGLAHRDPNVTTETVARKVRRAADVLAALAGEPDIGFVKVIGQVEADLFQLHSAYNDFNAAMFEEFRQRGLQVQTASSLVEKLEMYDSFHASEDPRNRELFQTYLHATFNASRSEWLAQKMAPCVRALLVRYEHFETGSDANNPVLEDVFKQWRAEKDQLMNPKQAKPMPVTQEDKMWEAPDAADATDVTKISEGPPMDKAIRKDVPRIGATTDVSAVAECVNDIVTQDADGKVSYNTPGTVELVDEGDQVDPIPSSIGRVVEPAPPKKTKKSDRDEDAMRRLMFIDESAPQGAATVPELPNEYFYNGKKHVTFKHGDLKFLTKLLRGHEMDDFPALIFDRGCWADVDTLLQVFNTARNARWGVRQLLRAAKADNKGRIRLLGIDVPMKDTLGQPLFPVRVRMAQGHNSKLIGNNPDADFFLATRFYSGLSEYEADLQSSVRGVTVLSREDTPPKLYHRTNEKGMKGILRDGMIAGSARSDRSHNYLSPYKLDDTHYKSGMRSNQPIELTIDTQRAIAAGCVFFVTETDGVLTRDNVPPDCVLSAIDTSKKNLPLYVAEHKEAAREGEPERIFRAKRDYEEAAAASSSSAPPPKQAAIAPKAIASKKMPKVVPKPAAIAEKDESMDLDEATREGEPADAAGAFDLDETKVEVEVEVDDTTDAGEDEPYPLGSHPCRECAAVVANGMLFCLRCKAPQTDDSKKITKRVFENSRLRQRLLATAATGAQKPIDDLLASDLRGLGEGPKKRGQMSAEAAAIRDAKDRKIRAAKLNFDTVSDRFEKDAQFNVRMMQEGRSLEDMQKFDHLSNAVLPDPGRSEEQRYLRAGSHYGGGNVPPAKLVAAVNDAAKRILTFDGEVYVSATTIEGITTEIGQILTDSLRSAQNQTDQTERLAERNRQAAVQNRPSQKGRGRTTAPEPMYRGYTQAQWDEYYRQRRGGYTQAEWDAWNRTHRLQESAWHRRGRTWARTHLRAFLGDLVPWGEQTKLALRLLETHHSASVLPGQVRNKLAEDSGQETMSQPWRCRNCKVLCKHAAQYCQSCGGHWQQIYEPAQPTTPGRGSRDVWDGGEWRAATPRKTKSPRRRDPKGKGQAPKGKQWPQAPGKGPKPPAGPTSQAPALSQLPTAPQPVAVRMPKPQTEVSQPAQPSEDRKMLESLVAQISTMGLEMKPELAAIIDQYQSDSHRSQGRQLHQLVALQTKAKRELHRISAADGKTDSLEKFATTEEAWTKQLTEASSQLALSTGRGVMNNHTEPTEEAMDQEDRDFEDAMEAENQHRHEQEVTAQKYKDLMEVLQKAQQGVVPAPREGSRTPRRKREDAGTIQSSGSEQEEEDFVSPFMAQLLALQSSLAVCHDTCSDIFEILQDRRHEASLGEAHAYNWSAPTQGCPEERGGSGFQVPVPMGQSTVEPEVLEPPWPQGCPCVAAYEGSCTAVQGSSRLVELPVQTSLHLHPHSLPLRVCFEPSDLTNLNHWCRGLSRLSGCKFSASSKVGSCRALTGSCTAHRASPALPSAEVPPSLTAQSQPVQSHWTSTAPPPFPWSARALTSPATCAIASAVKPHVSTLPRRPTTLQCTITAQIPLVPDVLAGRLYNECIESLTAYTTCPDWDGSGHAAFTVFDPPHGARTRRSHRTWTLLEYVADAVTSAPMRVRAIQLIERAMPGLHTPQLTLTPRDTEAHQLALPVDLRGQGGRVHTLVLATGMSAQDVLREAADATRGRLDALSARPWLFRLVASDGNAVLVLQAPLSQYEWFEVRSQVADDPAPPADLQGSTTSTTTTPDDWEPPDLSELERIMSSTDSATRQVLPSDLQGVELAPRGVYHEAAFRVPLARLRMLPAMCPTLNERSVSRSVTFTVFVAAHAPLTVQGSVDWTMIDFMRTSAQFAETPLQLGGPLGLLCRYGGY